MGAENEDSEHECEDKTEVKLDGQEEDREGGSEDERKEVSLRNPSRRPRDESLESKRSRKKAVQAAKAEKRLTKIPKHVKKRAKKKK